MFSEEKDASAANVNANATSFPTVHWIHPTISDDCFWRRNIPHLDLLGEIQSLNWFPPESELDFVKSVIHPDFLAIARDQKPFNPHWERISRASALDGNFRQIVKVTSMNTFHSPEVGYIFGKRLLYPNGSSVNTTRSIKQPFFLRWKIELFVVVATEEFIQILRETWDCFPLARTYAEYNSSKIVGSECGNSVITIISINDSISFHLIREYRIVVSENMSCNLRSIKIWQLQLGQYRQYDMIMRITSLAVFGWYIGVLLFVRCWESILNRDTAA